MCSAQAQSAEPRRCDQVAQGADRKVQNAKERTPLRLALRRLQLEARSMGGHPKPCVRPLAPTQDEVDAGDVPVHPPRFKVSEGEEASAL